jgi:PAS domain S-box-containing protein
VVPLLPYLPLLRLPRRPGVLVLSLWLASVPGFAQTPTFSPPSPASLEASEASVIRTFADFWQDNLRGRSRPVNLELVVYYYDPLWGNFWGHDGQEPGYLPAPLGLKVTKGDRIRLVGDTIGGTPRMDHETLRAEILEREVPVPTIDINGRVGDFHELKHQFVTTEAFLSRQDVTNPNHIILHLVSEGYLVRVFHYVDQSRLLDLPDDAILRISGLYSPVHQARTETLRIDLWVNSPEDIQYVGRLSEDPRFLAPLVPIVDLPVRFYESTPLVRIQGIVSAHVPGQGYKVRDTAGQVMVRTVQSLPLQIGDAIEAVGRPNTGGAYWVLRNGIVRLPRPELAAAIHAAMNEPATTLRLAEQVFALSPEEAAEDRPVDLTGIVMRTRRRAGPIFLHDPSGTLRIELGELDEFMISNGLGLRVRGVTVPGPFVPRIRATSIEPWGVAVVPEARPATLDQAMSGREEGQRLELTGYLSHVESDELFSRFTVSADTGDFVAIVPSRGEWHDLIGSIVSVRGVCQAVADDQQQLAGLELWATGSDDVHVEQAALVEPIQAPLRSVASLRQFNPITNRNHWARVRGVVLHQLPGRFLFLQDGHDGLLILSNGQERLQPGDVVEATGLPSLDGRRVVLREAVFRQLGRQSEPDADRIPAAHQPNGAWEDRLVQITGMLVSAVPEPDGLQLMLERDGSVFSATLPVSDAGSAAAGLEPGALLELTGVYQLIRDERRRPKGFQLHLRTPADIKLLQRPSWWTPQRALTITGALGSAISLGFFWVVVLRRRVARQTAQIREQVAKEAKLEARHRDIFENASDFIFTTDRSGRFTSFNPAGERLTGYSRESALRLSLTDLLVRDPSQPDLLASLRPQTDGTVTFQGELRKRDGTALWVETSARLIEEAGQPAGVLGIVRDITERRQIEQELRRARDAAEANTRMKSVFLANMSHEIRTPMNGVIGMSNLLLDTPLSGEQRDFAQTIRSSAESLLTVLNDILDFSKIEAGKLEFEALTFDLVEAVEHTIELLAPRAVAKQIELATFIHSDVPRHARGDPGRLRQVLLNLLSNALKFTEGGEVVVRISVSQTSAEATQVRFEVSDTGVGMGADVAARLFQPFSQADASTTRRFGGTGLGLAIARQIVELMRGTIGMRSTPGEGSTFWFDVPLTPVTDNSPEPSLDPAHLQGQRILAIEDMAATREMLQHYGHHWKLDLEMVPDAATGLRRLREAAESPRPFAAVLCDYSLPDQDGLSLIQAIRRDPLLSATPVAMLATLDRRLTPEEIGTWHISAVAIKPLRIGDLLAVLSKTLVDPARTPVSRGTMPPLPLPDGARNRGRVLVAEDNVVNQRVIDLQLKRLGYSVDIAGNGFEVLEALDRAHYDVVLMDCQMPEMDGYEATCRIRNSNRHRHVRIIALTANAMEGDREHCLSAGMDDYLSKPTRPAELQAALERATMVRNAGAATEL